MTLPGTKLRPYLNFNLLPREVVTDFIINNPGAIFHPDDSLIQKANATFQQIDNLKLSEFIANLYLATILQIEHRYVYALSDLLKMNITMISRFAQLLQIPRTNTTNEQLRTRIIAILSYAGLVADFNIPFSSTQVSTIQLSPWNSEFPQNLEGNVDFLGVFPKEGLFYLADTTGHNWKKANKLDRIPKIQNIWKEFDDQITLQEFQDLIALDRLVPQLSYQFQKIGQASTLTLGQITISKVNKFFGAPDYSRELRLINIGDNSVILVPVLNQLAQFPQVLAGYDNLFLKSGANSVSTEQERGQWIDYARAIQNAELGTDISNRQKSEMTLPNTDSYLFVLSDGVKDILYSGPESDFDFPTAKKTNEYVLPYLQQQVQLAIDSGWSVAELNNRLGNTIIENYNKFVAQGNVRESEVDDSSCIVIYLPSLNPTNTWKEEVTDLLAKINELDFEQKSKIPVPELTSIFKYCTSAWSNLPYDTSQNWCDRVQRIYRLILGLPVYSANQQVIGAYLDAIKQKMRSFAKIPYQQWQESKEVIERILTEAESYANRLIL